MQQVELQTQQREGILVLSCGQDVLFCRPKGFGKSLCYVICAFGVL